MNSTKPHFTSVCRQIFAPIELFRKGFTSWECNDDDDYEYKQDKKREKIRTENCNCYHTYHYLVQMIEFREP